MVVYTDGSCRVNPGGVGGYAAVIIDELADSNSIKIIAGGDPSTTNNRMELTAVLRALEYFDGIDYSGDITIYTDSQYVSRAINEGWLETWINKLFKNVKNQDLWLLIWKYICKLDVKIEWVKAHNNHEYNELADRLAREACYFQGTIFTYDYTK